MDNAVINHVYCGSSMNGGNHSGRKIPSLTWAAGAACSRPINTSILRRNSGLSEIYLTMMQKVFDPTIASFANSRGIVSAMMA